MVRPGRQEACQDVRPAADCRRRAAFPAQGFARPEESETAVWATAAFPQPAAASALHAAADLPAGHRAVDRPLPADLPGADLHLAAASAPVQAAASRREAANGVEAVEASLHPPAVAIRGARPELRQAAAQEKPAWPRAALEVPEA